MADDRASDDGVVSRELALVLIGFVLADTVSTGDNVAEVTDVSDLLTGASVGLLVRVEVRACCLAALS